MSVSIAVYGRGKHLSVDAGRARGLTGVLLLSLEKLDNLVTNITVGHLDIVLDVAIVVHEREETVIGDVNL